MVQSLHKLQRLTDTVVLSENKLGLALGGSGQWEVFRLTAGAAALAH